MSKKNQFKATIDDVARKAGVSIKTVSRVVNREPNVRTATRDRVLKAIDTLNYRPNMSARSLAGDRSYLIALLYDNPSANYISDLQIGALTKCHEAGYFLLVEECNTETDALEQKVQQLIERSSLDGIILTPPLCDRKPLLTLLHKLETPYVRIAPSTQLDVGPYVYIDDQKAAYDMTNLLISMGHQEIGFIKGHPEHGASALRYEGYCKALKENEIQIKEEWVQQGYFSYRSGMEAAEKILNQAHRPSAIFAADDDMAAGLTAVAHKLGISIPSELTVAGFDDTPIAKVVWPQLTTVRQPISEMARAAVELLIEGTGTPMNGINNKETRKLLLEFSIVERESSASPEK